MTNAEMIEEYYAALRKLEKRHEELRMEKNLYDKRIALLEEEIDEIWEVIATLKKHEKGAAYGWRGNSISAGYRRQGIPGFLGL